METTDFEDILREAASEVTALLPDELDVNEFRALRRSMNQRLEYAWNYHYWPDLMRTEKRYFAPVFGTQDFAPGDFCYYLATQKYYQCLQYTGTGLPPASKDTNGDYQTNAMIWAEAKSNYSGDDYDSTVAYAMGAIVGNPETVEFYARSGGIRSAGSATASLNRDWTISQSLNGYPVWGTLAAGDQNIQHLSTWDVQDNDSFQGYSSVDNPVTPDLVQNWTGIGPTPGPGPTFTTAFTVPDTSNAGYWCRLIPFTDKYVSYTQNGLTEIGVVASAWSDNPRITTRGHELNWFLSENGIQVLTPASFAWIEFRIRCPKIAGELYDATAVYAAAKQLYYRATSVPGNFYNVLSTTTAGDNPVAQPTKFAVVPIPRIFHRYLVHALAADWLRGPGGGSAEDVTLQMQIAEMALEEQKTLLVGQQSQRVKTVVRTR